MQLIIISGSEATGKTKMGKAIADILDCDYRGKDDIKEAMFDEHSRSTWHAKWYDNQAKTVLFNDLARAIINNKSIIIESNFIGQDKNKLEALLKSNTEVVEIHCIAKGFTSLKRFIKRNESGKRHKGHHDRRWYLNVFLQDSLRMIGIDWPYRPMNLKGRILKVDTTDFKTVNYNEIAEFIKNSKEL